MKQILFLFAFLLPLCAFSQTMESIRINEVMADPKGLTDFPETEYVELYNASDKEVNLAGWCFTYADQLTILSDMMLPGKGYVVLYREGGDIKVDQGGLAMSLSDFPRNLANTGKELALYDPEGEMVDAIPYPKAKRAIAWERTGDAWALCEDTRGGTPGSINSIEAVMPDTPVTPDHPIEPDEPAEPIPPVAPSLSSGDILINEIMADPKGSVDFPETEYVELLNRTTKEIQLAGCLFLYGDKAIELPPFLFRAGGYLILYRAGREILADPSAQCLPLERFPSALANTGKSLALLDPLSKEIDRVVYDKAKSGVSWERGEDGTWSLSKDRRGGTPGAANSLEFIQPDVPEQPESPVDPDAPDTPERPELPDGPVFSDIEEGDVIFNELLPNPFPNGGSEYVELYNRSERTLSLSELFIATRKEDGTLGTHYPLSSVTVPLEPSGYLLLSKEIEGVRGFYLTLFPDRLHALKLPILPNISATLVLFRKEEASICIIDEVRYSSQWHAFEVKQERGVALERIDPSGETQEAANWTSASSLAGFGTPGYENSQRRLLEDAGVVGVMAPVYEEIAKQYKIVYRLEEAGATCRAFVYDLAGKQVHRLIDHELLGTAGEYVWDGLDAHGKRIRPGVYLFWAEWVYPKGKVQHTKEPFLVR